MSQDAVLAALSSEPQTQKQLAARLHTDIGTIGDRLSCLMKKGQVGMIRLETRYRPNGYVRITDEREKGNPMRWPKY